MSSFPLEHKDGFRLLTNVSIPNVERNPFTSLLHQYLRHYEQEKCGLSQIVSVKVSYNKITDTYRSRIDSKRTEYRPRNNNSSNRKNTNSIHQTYGSNYTTLYNGRNIYQLKYYGDESGEDGEANFMTKKRNSNQDRKNQNNDDDGDDKEQTFGHDLSVSSSTYSNVKNPNTKISQNQPSSNSSSGCYNEDETKSCEEPEKLLLFETDYIEYRVGSDVVVHLGTRLDPEVASGTGLVGRVGTEREYAEWAYWIDKF